jgi:membrane-bound metal-dependent hydrolase YbcI (DUF457 family)
MLVGHLGVGLAAKAVQPKIGLGTLFAAAMLLDIVLWILVLAGVEAATVPPDYATHHYLYFNFPYSHSLLAAILWSAVAALAWAFRGDGEWSARIFSAAAITVAIVTFSHWFLDYLVHPAELPIAPGGPTLGLGLWDREPLELEIELALAGGGLLLYLVNAGMRGARGLAVIGLVAVMSAITAWGVYAPNPPASISMVAYVMLVTIGAAVAVGGWADARNTGGTSE